MGSRVAWMESELFYRVDGRIGVDDRIGVDGGEFQPNSEALAPGKHEQGGVAFPNMAFPNMHLAHAFGARGKFFSRTFDFMFKSFPSPP